MEPKIKLKKTAPVKDGLLETAAARENAVQGLVPKAKLFAGLSIEVSLAEADRLDGKFLEDNGWSFDGFDGETCLEEYSLGEWGLTLGQILTAVRALAGEPAQHPCAMQLADILGDEDLPEGLRTVAKLNSFLKEMDPENIELFPDSVKAEAGGYTIEAVFGPGGISSWKITGGRGDVISSERSGVSALPGYLISIKNMGGKK